MINMPHPFGSAAPYIKLFKTLPIHTVQSETLSLRSIAQVLLLMYKFRTMGCSPVDTDAICVNCQTVNVYF